VTTIEKYNKSKHFRAATYVCSSLILLFIVGDFSKYYSLKLSLTNPLIPKTIIEMAFQQFIRKAIFLFSGLLVVLSFIFYKKNVYAFGLSVFIIGYYILSNLHVPGWKTQLF
jgi:hypothetical protein